MNHIKKAAKSLITATRLCLEFAEKYGDRLPEGVAHLSLSMGSPSLFISTGCTEADRNNVLILIAETFGSDGWVQNLNYDRQSYNWTKTVDGVALRIDRAESIPAERESRPVHPSKFPLQLAQ